ncbi:hypothetical protein APW72_11515 [Staphylococcus aureus]|nr:hypothetical protein APW72_11515 [Staphylococcus aureus]
MFSTLFHVNKATSRIYKYQLFPQVLLVFLLFIDTLHFHLANTKKKLSNLCCLTPLYYPYFTIIHISLNYLMLASIFSIFLPSMTSLMRFVCNFLLSSNV